MRILMLGWEFPPFIAGGLGTACAGLTKSMVAQGHEITFVFPQPIPAGHESHVRLIGPRVLKERIDQLRLNNIGADRKVVTTNATRSKKLVQHTTPETREFELIESFQSPYPSSYPGVDAGDVLRRVVEHIHAGTTQETESIEEQSSQTSTIMRGLQSSDAKTLADSMQDALDSLGELGTGSKGYSGDLFADADRYARLASALCLHEQFDVIHAHDWLTYPAGMAVRALTGKPLVCHIHATEFDRSGEHINQPVYDLERMGMNAADRVIAVSRLTKAVVHNKYGVPDEKIDVVYNGVEQDHADPLLAKAIEKDEKIVLFLGRITMQKGPEYFIQAAKRVLEVYPKVKFVVAGSGDMAVRMIEDAAANGIGHKVLFTGFLRGKDVDKVYAMADCYVMPSVSEPFGIAPLEAMRNDTPVIVSKQSGVAEVLTHALKVDFWDTDEMANKIVAVLKYPPLSKTLTEHGRFELRGLTWDGASEKCIKSYARAIANQ
ncbi:MAG: glycosyltransferase [Phycisphaerales bacterium]|nr:glycosyltransferase [Phycisphaerales bacterium]